jgi:hypothetical protein
LGFRQRVFCKQPPNSTQTAVARGFVRAKLAINRFIDRWFGKIGEWDKLYAHLEPKYSSVQQTNLVLTRTNQGAYN